MHHRRTALSHDCANEQLGVYTAAVAVGSVVLPSWLLVIDSCSCYSCWLYFCRAMRCISAAYPVMRCLSRSWIMSKRINISSNFFTASDSHTILVFPYQTGWRYSDGNPLTGASNAGGVGKKRDSGRISGFAAYRSTVLSTVRVANCEKQSRDGRRRVSSTPRRPSSVIHTRRRRSVCDGLDVIRRRGGQNPLDTTPLVITPVFCCRMAS